MTYEQWYDIYITGKTKKEFDKIIGLKTSNGIEIKGVSKHAIEQAVIRKISVENAKDALINLLKIDRIKTDNQGRKSQRFIGLNATVNVNTDTGVVTTLWATGTGTRKKFRVNNNGD